jgi:hypothetical protein
MIESVTVQTLGGDTIQLGDVLADVAPQNSDGPVVMSCLSHYGDYNAWELTQQYVSALKEGRLTNSPVVLVGIGSVQAAQTFANDIGLSDDPRITLVTDETGCVTEALGCYRGWLTVDKKHKERYPYTDIPSGIKLLGMVLGFGSPGTIGGVIEGYTGDVTQTYGPFGRRWVIRALTQGSEKGRFPKVELDLEENESLKPFELATLRLQTGLHVVAKWRQLGPRDGDLFTRMGGTFVFSNKQCVYEYFDQGILNFANIDDICLVTEAAANGERYVPPSNKLLTKKNRQQFWEKKDREAKIRIEEERKRAEEARLEEERLDMEARAAEAARLEELDRKEAERIAEMARQGKEAKLARESEELLREAEDLLKITTEIDELEEKEDDDDDELEADISVDEILNKAEELEQKARASLESMQQTSQKVGEDSEVFQRKLLEARLKYEAAPVIRSDYINGLSLSDGPVTNAVPPKAVKDEEEDEYDAIMKQKAEMFQRRLLQSQLQYGQSTSSEPVDPSPSIGTQADASVDDDMKCQQEQFQQSLLKARIGYDKTKEMTRHQEQFQRSLLKARIRFEKKNEFSSVRSGNGHSKSSGSDTKEGTILEDDTIVKYTNSNTVDRRAAMRLALSSILLAGTPRNAKAFDKTFPTDLSEGDEQTKGITLGSRSNSMQRKQAAEQAKAKMNQNLVNFNVKNDFVPAVTWGMALWLLLGSRSNPLATPLANLLYDEKEEKWLQDRNSGLFASPPLPFLLLLTVVFLILGTITQFVFLQLADGDSGVCAQLAGVSLIGGGFLEIGRIASGEKQMTRDELDRAIQLKEEFNEFAEKRLIIGGNCHRSDIVKAFRRYHAKYRQAYSEDYPLTDLEIEKLLRAWNVRENQPAEMTSSGFYYGIQVNKDADVFV